jgi:hypothetical protein
MDFKGLFVLAVRSELDFKGLFVLAVDEKWMYVWTNATICSFCISTFCDEFKRK